MLFEIEAVEIRIVIRFLFAGQTHWWQLAHNYNCTNEHHIFPFTRRDEA